MISYIKGPLVEIEGDIIVVEARCVGYNIRVPLSLLDGLPDIGSEVRIYTYLQVREDAMSLYGFLNRQDLKMFRLLLGVNGIGPKGALGKTAQRLILDLKDRIPAEQIVSMIEKKSEEHGTGGGGAVGKEAVDALVALGYSAMEATKAVRQVEILDGMTVEQVLKASLKYMAF